MSWTVEYLDQKVLAKAEALPAEIRARLQRIITFIEAYVLEHVHEPYVKHLEGRLWATRMSGQDRISRAL